MKFWTLVATLLVAVSALAQSESYRFSTANPPPSVLSKVKPNYTEQAKKAGLEGEAVVAVTVDENGLPNETAFVRFQQGAKQIQDSLGLDEMAVAAVKLWRFRPAMKEGKPISMRVTVAVEFALPKTSGPDIKEPESTETCALFRF